MKVYPTAGSPTVLFFSSLFFQATCNWHRHNCVFLIMLEWYTFHTLIFFNAYRFAFKTFSQKRCSVVVVVVVLLLLLLLWSRWSYFFYLCCVRKNSFNSFDARLMIRSEWTTAVWDDALFKLFRFVPGTNYVLPSKAPNAPVSYATHKSLPTQ